MSWNVVSLRPVNQGMPLMDLSHFISSFQLANWRYFALQVPSYLKPGTWALGLLPSSSASGFYLASTLVIYLTVVGWHRAATDNCILFYLYLANHIRMKFLMVSANKWALEQSSPRRFPQPKYTSPEVRETCFSGSHVERITQGLLDLLISQVGYSFNRWACEFDRRCRSSTAGSSWDVVLSAKW